ncbi:DUF928 domain-containing protein [Aetokthonos hydrillicola Thurmond2011]|jgi:hypothetical protein|uniref:DUF928 domain-containing protein n=1 Tax=Aetokthonos hydrillicola Thurmond2011 TaxID=2712845 RepID=A0AAP5M7V8_9CYAN|nr:DUF928 domain-containing protein [Aetokthonos hydrillicola]MBO3462214.1 DUF928 domain-containing protein [Aetokthonos hydrillicola CCALA 1050]MBW4585088.1 DUF928 domain-containing protein [Aetokthonos hydrillicola CCALA 1050]MDR9894152.1 DUF928 domain-containing protein [Aetokthonos hydrillicola Thurmond2011]
MNYALPVMLKHIQLSLAIILTFASFAPVQAQSTKPLNLNASRQSKKQLTFNTPPPPPNIGAPSQRKAGGNRGCSDVSLQNTQSSDKVLTALAPEYSKEQLVLGLTTQKRPTLWFYVPYKSDSVYAKLVIEDEKSQTIYKTPLMGTPGVVSVSLPPTSYEIKIGKLYHWYFNIYCKQDNEFITSVEGKVQLLTLNPTIKTQLDKATPRQQVELYAANGIWYEALTTLANLRRSSPQDANLASDWASLLGSVGLQNLAAEPIVDCCKPQAPTANFPKEYKEPKILDVGI